MKQLSRCSWAESDPLLRAYHDEEWGVPVYDSRMLWEMLMLEGFQAGLSWLIVLRKRETFRAAFRNFDPEIVAGFNESDVERLMADSGIIRARAKIQSTIEGARIYLEMQAAGEDIAKYIWALAGGKPILEYQRYVPGQDGALRENLGSAQEAWLQVCRADDCLCLHAGNRDGQRSCRAVLPAQAGEGETVSIPTGRGKKIVIATIGSLGDLHPCLALALELKRRGHRAVLATSPFYAERIRALGLEFAPLRPDWDPTDSEMVRRCENIQRGPEVLVREFVLPHLRDTYDDLLKAAAGADYMIAGEIVYAAPLVSEKLKLPWASAILSPCSFFSSHDPSVLVNAPWLTQIRKLGWRTYRFVLDLCRLATRHWWAPVRRLRREEGLREQCDPVFRDKFAPGLVLALFSRTLAEPQPDWPQQTCQPGFAFFDGQQSDLSEWPELEAFLAEGSPPIVFTLGSTVVNLPGNFYEASLQAARILGRRAVLLGVGPEWGADNVMAVKYAPYSLVFAHAAVIVHQGGSGTTGQALRAGKPALIVPFGWDQPDNAARIERQGTGLTIERKRYSSQIAAAALKRLLEEPSFAERAAEVKEALTREDAVKEACDAIERLLSAPR